MTEEQADRVIARIGRLRSAGPIFVGLDGRSGAGKSTLAAEVAAAATGSALVIEGDDFYTGGSGGTWDARTPAEKADLVIDWRRQTAVLAELRSGGSATWRPFDWEADDWDGEPPPLGEAVETAGGDVVILEGAYSCRPELHDHLDLRILLATPDAERRRRLLDREGDAYRAEWEHRWSEAEEHYFTRVMPGERFDLVL